MQVSNGKTETQSMDERVHQLMKAGYTEEKAESKAQEERGRRERQDSAVSPPGALNLPPLLEAKRLKYKIPDCLFEHHAAYDRCFAIQVAEADDDGMFGTGIIMPETTRMYQELSSPKVVILSAGLKALDHLRSHGMELGHTVIINQMTPYRYEAGMVAGKIQRCLIIRSGDVCGSLELEEAMRKGYVRIEQRRVKSEDGTYFMEHAFVDQDGNTWNPSMPWIGDDA